MTREEALNMVDEDYAKAKERSFVVDVGRGKEVGVNYGYALGYFLGSMQDLIKQIFDEERKEEEQ